MNARNMLLDIARETLLISSQLALLLVLSGLH